MQLKEKVREVIDYDKSFNNAETCHEFIRSIRYERIFLIITPKLIQEIFQQNIHEIRLVQAIFVFDPDGTFWCIEDLQRSSYKVSANALEWTQFLSPWIRHVPTELASLADRFAPSWITRIFYCPIRSSSNEAQFRISSSIIYIYKDESLFVCSLYIRSL